MSFDIKISYPFVLQLGTREAREDASHVMDTIWSRPEEMYRVSFRHVGDHFSHDPYPAEVSHRDLPKHRGKTSFVIVFISLLIKIPS